ncbi:hypothetical protein D0T84_04730 [Dysgonomonas sp. 521]|nr:hypothetical protein [Dysgonomonas sp. 521]
MSIKKDFEYFWHSACFFRDTLKEVYIKSLLSHAQHRIHEEACPELNQRSSKRRRTKVGETEGQHRITFYFCHVLNPRLIKKIRYGYF